MSANERIKPVDSGYSRLNKLVGIVACGRIYGLSVYVQEFVGDNGRAAVTGVTHAVEYPAEHFLRYRKLLTVTCEPSLRSRYLQALRIVEKLHYGFVAVYFEYFSLPNFPVCANDVDKLVVLDAFNALDQHKRADYFADCLIFLKHFLHLDPML